MVRRTIKKYVNPVKIKPAIKKDEKYDFENKIIEGEDRDLKQKEVSLNNFGKKIKDKYKDVIPETRKRKELFKGPLNELKGKFNIKSDGVEESKNSEPEQKTSEPTQDKNDKATKIQSLIRKNNAKKIVEEKRKSIESTKDDKTVVENLVPQAESYKINFNTAKSIIDKYKDLSDDLTIDNFNKEDKIKLRGLMSSLGVSLNTKKLKSLRNKIK